MTTPASRIKHLAALMAWLLFGFVLALLVVLLPIATADAQERSTWLQLQLMSSHPDRDGCRGHEVQDITPGAGVLIRQDDILGAAGIIRNSCGRWAGYGIAGWQPIKVDALRLGAFVGVTHNYPYRDGGPIPLAGLIASVEGKRVGVHVTFIPPVADVSKGAATISFAWRF